MSTARTVARHDTHPASRRFTLDRVELELQHREALSEAAHDLALAELELERYGAALAEDDARRRRYLIEATDLPPRIPGRSSR